MTATIARPITATLFNFQVQASFLEHFENGKVTSGLAEWAMKAGKKIGLPKSKPSKVGIAREYCHLLIEAPSLDEVSVQASLTLLAWIQSALRIPNIQESPRQILK